jgi:hypothetical protein
MIHLFVLLSIVLASHGAALAEPQEQAGRGPSAGMESIDQALCRMIERAATTHRLEIGFLTRLIWRESSFRPGVVSRAGAQGVAQFMPKTAAERGLVDPFDPEKAIPKAAEFLAELLQSFGNRGLAAAAYNGGPTRVRNWLAGQGELPAETRAFVAFITGRSADDWARASGARASGAREPETSEPETREIEAGEKRSKLATADSRSCLRQTALLRRGGRDSSIAGETAFAPWGVQLAGNFSKALALASYTQARMAYGAIIGEITPMIIGTRLRSRGTRAFYRVRVPAPTRAAAETLCSKLRSAGGNCMVLAS